MPTYAGVCTLWGGGGDCIAKGQTQVLVLEDDELRREEALSREPALSGGGEESRGCNSAQTLTGAGGWGTEAVLGPPARVVEFSADEDELIHRIAENPAYVSFVPFSAWSDAINTRNFGDKTANQLQHRHHAIRKRYGRTAYGGNGKWMLRRSRMDSSDSADERMLRR